MIDRLFTLTLTFALLAGATLAIGDEFLSSQPIKPVPVVAQLPRVVITGQVQRAQTDVARAETELTDGAAGAERVQ